MALDYFGQQTSNSDDNTGTQQQLSFFWGKSFACPGSGSRTVEELSALCWKMTGATIPKIRGGIWTTAGVLVGESDEVSVAGTASPGTWQGGMSAAAIRPKGGSLGDAVTITGGTSYLLGVAETNLGALGMRYQSGGSSGDVEYQVQVDYSAGLPDIQYSRWTDWSGWWNVRCGLTQQTTDLNIHASECVGSNSIFG